MRSNCFTSGISRKGLQYAIVLGILGIVLALAPAAKAGVDVGISFHVPLPPNVHVSVGNYEPYYVGRVYYEPHRAWRQVYSFPVETPYGVVYQPYVYEGRRIVFHDYIPGPELGYSRFLIEGHGHYDPVWRRAAYRHGYAHGRAYEHGHYYNDHGNHGWQDHDGRSDAHGHGHGHGNGHGHGHDRD